MKKKQINPLFMGLIMIVLGVILVVYSRLWQLFCVSQRWAFLFSAP